MNFLKKTVPGILICLVIATIATFWGNAEIGSVSLEVIGAPVFAILMGMIVTAIRPSLASGDTLQPGVKFTSKKILQWAVIILGFTLNFGKIIEVGGQGLPVIVCTISISLIVAYVMMKLLKIDGKVATLIGVGSSICGGSAIAATAPVIEADDEEVAQAISVIFLFNVVAALIFPSFGHAIGLGSEGFAFFAGTAVNDTSSVTATATTAEGIYGVSGILATATVVKLTRTLAIIPITFTLAIHRMRKAKAQGGTQNSFSFKKIFPWFILFFMAASLVTTVVLQLPAPAFTKFYNDTFVALMKDVAKFFIAMAMCAIGLNTDIVKLVKKGGKPILLGFTCWASITAMSLGVQLLTNLYYSNM